MKPTTRLSSAVFQLTPTRTRCDLIIIANGKKEKIASGLLNPFLAHLKAAQDQIAKGGYSILLEPETVSDAAWFTKATVERFVRFVSTPEILERVYTIETEILQIGEAIALQDSNNIGQSNVEDHRTKHVRGCEGDTSLPNATEEKAIVLYKPGVLPPEANGSCSEEGNSKVQLLKVLETRKTVLQKEQGMAFARAVAAGFEIDQMAPLLSFAECFGALRLTEACSKFMDLWKTKHETGQWVDIEAVSTPSDFSAMNGSGIILSVMPNKHDESRHEPASENYGKSGSTNNAGNPVLTGQQEYVQGQFPHLVFPPWPMHATAGAQPLFQPYPVQGMPYYPTYIGNGPFLHPMEHSPSNYGHQPGQERQSPDVDRTRSFDTASDAEVQKPRKKSGGSNKKQPGTVVIRNINYITSKEKKSSSETNSDSDSDIDIEDDVADGHDNSNRSSNIKGSHLNKLNFDNDEVSNFEKDTDDRRWQAFQNCLMRGSDEDAHADNDRMFGMEKGVKVKRHTNTANDDPLALGALGKGETQDSRARDISRISGSMSRGPRRSGDEVLFSNADNDFRGSNDKPDIQFVESNGRKILSRTSHEDFMISSQRNQPNFRNSSDVLAVNSFEGATTKMDRESSHQMADENFIVPFRSMSLDQVGGAYRTPIDCEIPSTHRKLDSEGNRNRISYEPDDLSLMPERGTEKNSSGYDLALDYEMQVYSEEKGKKDVSLKKLDNDRKSKVVSDSLHKQRTGGPIRKAKLSKMSPLEDARARAEKLRSYKADLQKMKKEKEEAEAKRLLALKLERQKRIAGRGGSTSAKPSLPSPQTKQFPSKLSPATNRGSKFSDSEPGSSSPLQRSKIRNSIRPSDPLKFSKSSKVSKGNHMAGNRLTRSSSSLSEPKRESNGVTPDSKASMSRIRRLSEPKIVTNPPVTSMKARSTEALSKRKLSDGPARNKVSAIINLDKSKAASLPELKISTSKSHVNAAHQTDADDSPIVEKTVVMLEYKKSSLPTSHFSEGKSGVLNQQSHDGDKGERSNAISKLAPIYTPPPPMDGVGKEPIMCQLQQSGSNEARTAYSKKGPLDFANVTTAEKPYQAPYARVSSLEDPCTHKSEYGKAPLASSERMSRAEETVKTHVPVVKSLKMEKDQITSEKSSVKEPSKGLSRLLKFGKKNHASSSVDQSVDSECTNADGVEHHDSARKLASTSEVSTLKNLISQDETSAAGNGQQKTSRHFSLFSTFRSKTSEKKEAS